jgi:hypothetical protein
LRIARTDNMRGMRGDDAFLTRIATVSRRLKSETERRLRAHGVHAGQQFVLGCLWDRHAYRCGGTDGHPCGPAHDDKWPRPQ